MDALLFSLAIAVGITPQLLPAVVSSSLAAGSRRMSRRKVLVKRLVCIEDLGNVDVLFTDKTGTLTSGHIDYARAVPAGSDAGDAGGSEAVLRWGLLCTESSRHDGRAVGGNPLDQALWNSPAAADQQAQLATYTNLGVLPFDHERNMVSVVVRDAQQHLTLVTKGAPETVLDRCVGVPGVSAGGVGERVRRRQPGRRRRHPRYDRGAAADGGRRERADPGRAAGVPRPTQARRRGRTETPRRSRHHRQDRHRRQPRRRDQGLPRPRTRRHDVAAR